MWKNLTLWNQHAINLTIGLQMKTVYRVNSQLLANLWVCNCKNTHFNVNLEASHLLLHLQLCKR